ncbi:hypothetical protein KI387_029612, partial [Taxus chinensis]
SCEDLKASLCTEAVGSIDINVSPFLEAQITAMAKRLENLSSNLAHEVHNGLWFIDCEVERHKNDIFPSNSVRTMVVDCEIFHGVNDEN